MKPSPKSMFCIYRVQRRKSSMWVVRVHRCNKEVLGKDIQVCFGDYTYGGKSKALIVAKIFRDAALKKIEKRERKYQQSLKGGFPDRRGERSFTSKFTNQEVLLIRKLRKEGHFLKTIADIFRVRFGKSIHLSSVCNIANGHTWNHLPGVIKKHEQKRIISASNRRTALNP